MYDFAMAGDDAFDVMHDEEVPCRGERMLADAMISLAIRDISKPKHRDQALRWVNDTTARHVMAFRSCCEILGRPYKPLKARINRYARSDKDIEAYSIKKNKPRKKRTGPKKTNVCDMTRCDAMTAGKMCHRCKNVLYNRRALHPDEPELWFLPVQPRGGYRKLTDVLEQVNG